MLGEPFLKNIILPAEKTFEKKTEDLNQIKTYKRETLDQIITLQHTHTQGVDLE